MNGHSRHPGTEELADFQAGASEGTRGDQVAAHIAACPECASVSERLSQVSAALASIPAPAMPGDVEIRIASALAAEAARRTPAAAVADPAADGANAAALSPVASSGARRSVVTSSSPAGSSPATAPRRAWRKTRRPSYRTSGLALVTAAASLVLAFAGYWLSGPGSQATPAVASGGSANAGRSGPAGAVPGAHRLSPSLRPALGPVSTFVIVVAATDFHMPTFQAQVREQLAAPASPSRESPSRSLVACVMHLTGGARPELVEEARYDSRPAYVIAVPNHAWAIARPCTGSPAVLSSVSLAPGH